MHALINSLASMWEPFYAYLFLRRALLGCLALSIAAGPLGVLLVLKRMTLVGDALSHGLLPGIAIAFIFCGPSVLWMSVGGVVAGLAVASAAALASRRAVLTEDGAFAGFYIFSLALGVMLLSAYGGNIDLLHILFGSILSISKGSLFFMTMASSITIIFLCVFYRPILLECFDPVFFRSIGGNVTIVRMGFLCFLTLTLVTSFQALGTFMALGLLILPALIMRLISHTFWIMCFGAGLIGFVCSALGLIVSYHTQCAAGPTIIVTLGLCYCCVLICTSLRLRFVVMALLWAIPSFAKPLSIVTSFSILKDLVQQVGGDAVIVHTLVGPDADVHQYHPTPHASKTLSQCHLVVMNGLGLERWMDNLLSSTGYEGPVLVATTGLKPYFVGRGKGRLPDPHMWQDVSLVKRYVHNIRDTLCQLRPQRKGYFTERARRYEAELDRLDQWIRDTLQAVPEQKRVIVTEHRAFSYYGAAYGIQIFSLLGLSTEAETSAKAMSLLIEEMRARHVSAIFLENMHNHAAMKMLAEEAGINTSGTLYADALSDVSGPASTYCAMMRANTRTVLHGLSHSPKR